MRKYLLSAFSAALPLLAAASTQWTLQGNVYSVDTLYHATVGPGTTHTSLKLEGPYKLRVAYATIDLTNPNVEMRTVQASTVLQGGNSLTGMVSKYQNNNCRYIAGVNADFFGNSQPIGTSVVDGEYYYALNNGWSHWAIDNNKIPKVADMVFSGTVTAPDGSSHELAGINRGRDENNLVIYNSRKGANTGTNAYGTEVSATILSGSLAPGQTAEMLVGCDPVTAGSMTIPSDGVVISGHGTAKEFLSKLKAGDKVTVSTAISADGQSIAARQVAGGRPLILAGGQVLNTQSALDHLTSLNPRTAIGYDATGAKLVMLVVDGRTSTSQGCVSKVLADIMLATGCTEAMNFDGGGSSTIYVDNLGVRNSPSDGKERAVVNAVFAISPTPVDNAIASIEFEDHAIVLPKYGIYRPKLHAFNRYGVWLADADFEMELSCDAALGEITSDGALLASGSGCHALTAKVGTLTATIPVTVGSATPEFKRKSILVDGFYDYTVEVQSLVGETMMSVANQALSWSSDDPSIATVDDNGLIHGVATGQTVVRGKVGDVTNEIVVNVEIPTEHYRVVDPMNNRDDWTVTSSNLKDLTMTGDNGGEGMTVDFTVSSTRSPSLSFAREIVLWSRPDALEINIKADEGAYTALNVTYSCDGARNAIAKVPLSLAAGADNLVRVPWADFFTTDAPEAYPLMIKRLQLVTSTTTGQSYSTHLGALKAYYSNISNESGVSDISGDHPADGIDLSKPADFYNLQGVRVANPSPGNLYIVKQGAKVAKLLVK